MGDGNHQRTTHPLSQFFVFVSFIFATKTDSPFMLSPHGCHLHKGGSMFIGSRNVTMKGLACQPWAENSPHQVNASIKDNQFPDGSKEAAKNYCRNPGKQDKWGVWCYTADPNVEWEFCDICPDNYNGYNSCLLSDKGKDYKGIVNHTRSFRECVYWKDHPNASYVFADGTAEDAQNFCRNPNPNEREGPWCFMTPDRGADWDFCDVCTPFEGTIIPRGGIAIQSSERNEDMTRHACLQWCMSFVLCMGIVSSVTPTNNECRYYFNTGESGEEVADTNYENFQIERPCNRYTAGKNGYFQDYTGVRSENLNLLLPSATIEQCDVECLAQKKTCRYYEYTVATKECRSWNPYCCPKEYSDDGGVETRLLIQCKSSVADDARFEAEKKQKDAGKDTASRMKKGGGLYMGSRNVTKSGKTCQPWAENSPNRIPDTITDVSFPDGSKVAAKNYCRNPGVQDKDGVWCYTMDATVPWEFCDIFPDNFEGYGGCALDFGGSLYIGVLAHTRTFQECKYWKDLPDEKLKFPDGSAEEAKNYCRNPNPKERGGPWCFIAEMKGVSWDYCDVCKPFEGTVTLIPNDKRTYYVNPEMSRLACINWCVNMAYCVGAAGGKSNNRCLYMIALEGSSQMDDDLELYLVERACNNHNMEAQRGYFVEFTGVQTHDLNPLLSVGSVLQCDEKCLITPECAYYEWTKDTRECRSWNDLCCREEVSNVGSVLTRIPIHCDPKMQPSKDVQAELQGEAAQPAETSQNTEVEKQEEKPKEEEPSKNVQAEPQGEAAQTAEAVNATLETTQQTTSPNETAGKSELEATTAAAGDEEPSEGEATAPKAKKGGSGTTMIIVIVLLVVALGVGGFAYYKLVYLKGKDKDKGEDKEKGKAEGTDKGKIEDKGKAKGSKGEQEKLIKKKPLPTKTGKVNKK